MVACNKFAFAVWRKRESFLNVNLSINVGAHLTTVLFFFNFTKSGGFVSLAGEAWLVSISGAVLFLFTKRVNLPLEFEFCVNNID